MQKHGLFITVEGQDGAGKTTNIEFVRELLSSSGLDVLETREPGGTGLGEALRELVLHGADPISADAELLVIFAARAQHLAEIIRPALQAGRCVLCDRFTDATYAYQGGGRGIPVDRIATLEDLVQGQLRPDLTLLLDVDPRLGRDRSRGRSQPDRFEGEAQEFRRRVRRAYLERAREHPDRIKLVDAGRPLPEVRRCIEAIVRRWLSS